MYRCVNISLCLHVYDGELREIQFDGCSLLYGIRSEGGHIPRVRREVGWGGCWIYHHREWEDEIAREMRLPRNETCFQSASASLVP